MNGVLRALIVDDEPPARRALLRLLRDIPDVKVEASASNGLQALEVLARQSIDLLLLDIEMPALAGIELAARLDPHASSAVIFITAWPQYAVDAFHVNAADYLLKPVAPERLQMAIARARQRLGRLELQAASDVLRARQPATGTPDHVWVTHGASRLRLPLEEVEWFAADGDYVQAHTGDRAWLMHGSLNALQATLPRFLRVHRSTLVNVDAVTRVILSSGHLRLVTRSGAELKVGRRARKRVRERLG
jgi:DNA-binding LytR/AlgR family response regulator